MALIVQKYGGSSLRGVARIRAVADRVSESYREGDTVVVVVSAVGGVTDHLLDTASHVSADPDPRETDQLVATGEQQSAALAALALRACGVPAVSLTGGQAGIRVAGRHGAARIQGIDPHPLRTCLQQGRVPVVAGFQGVRGDGATATIGRGGSDTSAAAIAAALRADWCEICTDTAGVATADPRVSPAARVQAAIPVDLMSELAWYGAKVIHPRAVELAELHQVPMRVRATSGRGAATTIGRRPLMRRLEDPATLTGIAHMKGLSCIRVTGREDDGHPMADVLREMARQGIGVVGVTQSRSPLDEPLLEVLVDDSQFAVATDAARLAFGGVGGCVSGETGLGAVSLVGVGLMSRPWYAARMFGALHEAQIVVRAVATAQNRVTAVLGADDIEQAVRLVHDAFDSEDFGITTERNGDDQDQRELLADLEPGEEDSFIAAV